MRSLQLNLLSNWEAVMSAIYTYPGSFCPPTYGHLEVLREAAEMVPAVTVICSVNEDKDPPWFTAEQCVNLWRAYDLPENVRILTLAQFMAEGNQPSDIVMIRGIRNEEDLDYEKGVVFMNAERYNIRKYMYLVTGKEFQCISSSAARRAAVDLDFEKLSQLVAPGVVTALLQYVLELNNLVMVTGLPAVGKSTVLQKVMERDESFVHINTDLFNRQLQSRLAEVFPGQNLVQMALETPVVLMKAIKEPWVDLLRQQLRLVKPGSNLLLEIAYGLRSEMNMSVYLGGKILNLSCGRDEARKRVALRGTLNHNPFIEVIPDGQEVVDLCERQQLQLLGQVDTRQSPEKSATQVIALVKGGADESV